VETQVCLRRLQRRQGRPSFGPRRESRGRTQFRWFVTMWVMAFSFHYFEQRPLDAWAVMLAGIPCIVAPGSAAAFALFLIVGGSTAAIHLPATSNHIFLALLVHLAFAAGAVAILRSKRRSTRKSGIGFVVSWMEVVRTPAAFVLPIVYFFTVFHKLNSSFFDPRVSCAGTLLGNLFALQGLPRQRIPDEVVVVPLPSPCS
jgi:hypothetical protein